MVWHFGIHGIFEIRRYGFGGVYLTIGETWFTLKRGSMP